MPQFPDRPPPHLAESFRKMVNSKPPIDPLILPDEPTGTDALLRELIDEIRGLRMDLKMQDIRSGKRLIGE